MLQSLLAFLGALIAASIALVVAFVAYPRQKEKDRLIEIARERRSVYRNFVTKSRLMKHNLILGRDNANAAGLHLELEGIVAEMLVISGDDVFDRCRAVLNSAVDLAVLIYAEKRTFESDDHVVREKVEEFDKLLRNAVRAIREEVLSNTRTTDYELKSMMSDRVASEKR